jgi:hypothetical protein
MANAPDLPRPVKPRTKSFENFPILATNGDHFWDELTGVTGNYAQLIENIGKLTESRLFVLLYAGDFIRSLARQYGEDERFQIVGRLATRDGLSGPKRLARTGNPYFTHTAPFWYRFGFRASSKYSGIWHHILDPKQYTTGLRAGTLEALIEWATDVRSWCQATNVPIYPTPGTYGAAFLTDPRFYPDARRKIPRFINERSRPALPGNYYFLRGDHRKRYFGVYEIDMNAAHHNAAIRVSFPDANTTFARGNYWTKNPKDPLSDKPWLWANTPAFERALKMYGLFYCRLNVPSDESVYLQNRPQFAVGTNTAFIFSNEIEILRELGVEIVYLIAAWGSFQRDTGLARFGQWAISELSKANEQRRTWLKPTLISVHGCLACRPETSGGTGFYRTESPRCNVVLLPVRGSVIPLYIPRPSGWEPGFVNVIHRGMIEAETRKRLVQFDRVTDGRALCLYADSAFMQNAPVNLPEGWRIKAKHDWIAFLDHVSWASNLATKMPGRTGEQRKGVA